jgi:hypothetical protein
VSARRVPILPRPTPLPALVATLLVALLTVAMACEERGSRAATRSQMAPPAPSLTIGRISE